MPRRQSNPTYLLLLVALVATVALSAGTLAEHVIASLRGTVSVEARHGVLAGKPISLLVSSARTVAEVSVVGDRNSSATAQLVAFESLAPDRVTVDRDADFAWLDSGLIVRRVEPGVRGGATAGPPSTASFLLVLPLGFIDRERLSEGERLLLL